MIEFPRRTHYRSIVGGKVRWADAKTLLGRARKLQSTIKFLVLQFRITDSVWWKSRTVSELYDESTLRCVKYDDDSCAEQPSTKR
jgi:hypothetical protein